MQPDGATTQPEGYVTSMTGKGLSGMFFSGVLVAFLGAILPVWRYHIEPNFLLIGGYFLCQNIGMLLGPVAGAKMLRKQGIAAGFWLGCLCATVAMLVLAAFSPPAPFGWRMLGLALIGFAAGLINTSVFHAVTGAYERHPAATLNLSGMLFGLGCLALALAVSGSFFTYTVPSMLILLAVPFGFASVYYGRTRFPSAPAHQERTWRQTVAEFKSPVTVLFALLLFFAFGNEGALAGWLALFLTVRLGISPANALLLLALYWLALTLGRILTQWVLPRVSHGRLLTGAVFFPMFGCLILSATDNLFGAITGVLLAGGGFAVIMPLVLEKVGNRFPYFHPGFFSGIFSAALSGALLAPASLGLLAHYLGIWVVVGLPLAGSVLVLMLLLLILLESRLSAGPAGSGITVSSP
jgi:FHS family glucose/mannose:H+ symporter-like MFS transporter